MGMTINVITSGRSHSEAKIKCEVVKILLENFETEISTSVIKCISGISIHKVQSGK